MLISIFIDFQLAWSVRETGHFTESIVLISLQIKSSLWRNNNKDHISLILSYFLLQSSCSALYNIFSAQNPVVPHAWYQLAAYFQMIYCNMLYHYTHLFCFLLFYDIFIPVSVHSINHNRSTFIFLWPLYCTKCMTGQRPGFTIMLYYFDRTIC